MSTYSSDMPRQPSLRLVRDALPQEDLKELMTKSDLKGIAQWTFQAAVILLSAMLSLLCFDYNAPTVCTAVALVLQAFLMSFLFMPLHECTHLTAFKTRSLNVAVAHISGFLCFRPPLHYKLYHFAHHRHTGDPEHDPELQETPTDFQVDQAWKYFLYISGLPFWFDRCASLNPCLNPCTLMKNGFFFGLHGRRRHGSKLLTHLSVKPLRG